MLTKHESVSYNPELYRYRNCRRQNNGTKPRPDMVIYKLMSQSSIARNNLAKYILLQIWALGILLLFGALCSFLLFIFEQKNGSGLSNTVTWMFDNSKYCVTYTKLPFPCIYFSVIYCIYTWLSMFACTYVRNMHAYVCAATYRRTYLSM